MILYSQAFIGCVPALVKQTFAFESGLRQHNALTDKDASNLS
jgi:hypothetical protein